MKGNVPATSRSNPLRRRRRFRSDKSIANVMADMAEQLGLPVEAFGLQYPSGVSAHADSNIGNLRKQWRR